MNRTIPHLRRSPSGTARQQGLTLVELMVAMVISMLLMIAITSTYLSQRLSYNTQGDLSEIQENARAIAQLLQREVRQAGYLDFVAEKSFQAAAKTIDASNDGGLNNSDSLTFRYFGSSVPGAVESASGVKADGSLVNCAGNPVDSFTETVETYSVVNVNNIPWLQCTVNGTATLLYPNIEYFQILLGEDLDGDQSVDRFSPPGTANMDNVRAVVASVVLRGNSTTNTNPVTATLNHFGRGYAPGDTAPAGDAGAVVKLPTDGRLRKHFTFYVAVRNRLN